MLVDGPNFFRYVLRFVPSEHRAHAEHLAIQIHQVLGRYLRGQLILIVLMSTVTFLVLEYGFHLPYALWVGILTGILEIIPVVGPITAGAIAATIGFSQGGASQAAAIAIVYFVLRQVEDQLVMPLVVGRAVHVHPLVTIFAVLVGEKIAGVLGMILAVPIAATLKVVLDYAYPTGKPAPRIELPDEPRPPERLPEVVTPLALSCERRAGVTRTCAAPRPVAFGPDLAAVGQDQVLGDRQAQPSARARGARRVGLVEALEDAAQVFGLDAHARVGDPQLDAARSRAPRARPRCVHRAGVNLIALPSRFDSTWPMRRESAHTHRSSSASARPRPAEARPAARSAIAREAASRTSSSARHGARPSSSRPASARARSSSSVTICARPSTSTCMRCRKRGPSTGSSIAPCSSVSTRAFKRRDRGAQLVRDVGHEVAARDLGAAQLGDVLQDEEPTLLGQRRGDRLDPAPLAAVLAVELDQPHLGPSESDTERARSTSSASRVTSARRRPTSAAAPDPFGGRDC